MGHGSKITFPFYRNKIQEKFPPKSSNINDDNDDDDDFKPPSANKNEDDNNIMSMMGFSGFGGAKAKHAAKAKTVKMNIAIAKTDILSKHQLPLDQTAKLNM